MYPGTPTSERNWGSVCNNQQNRRCNGPTPATSVASGTTTYTETIGASGRTQTATYSDGGLEWVNSKPSQPEG
jgi:hypothetical protein